MPSYKRWCQMFTVTASTFMNVLCFLRWRHVSVTAQLSVTPYAFTDVITVCDINAVNAGIFMPLVTSSDFSPSMTSPCLQWRQLVTSLSSMTSSPAHDLTFLSGRPWRDSRIQAGRFCPLLSSLVQSLSHLFKDKNHRNRIVVHPLTTSYYCCFLV